MGATVLYISYDGMTDNLGQAQVIPYLIGLQKLGHTIHILSCEKPQQYAERKEHIAQLLSKNSIQWHPISYTAKPPVVSTVLDIMRLRKQAARIVQKEHITLLHCRSYIAAGVGLYIQKKYALPWIFDMRGFWADERVEGRIWNLSNPIFNIIYKYFKKQEARYIARASHIVSLTHAGKKEIETWDAHKTSNTPLSVIPCCADLEVFSHETITKTQKTELRKTLGITEDQFILSYLGSFGTWYMTEEMFEFFSVLLTKQTDAIFLCLTPDSPEWITRIAARYGIPKENLRIIRVHREQVPLYASLSHWSVFFIKPVYSKQASSPTKMGELLGLGIPLVCNAGVGDVETIMQDCESGKCVSSYTQQEYAECVDYMLSQTSISQTQLREVAHTYYSLEKGVTAYADIYKTCIFEKN